MNTCKTCCYWTDGKNGFGACELIQALEFSAVGNNDTAFIEVSADDDSNLQATLITRDTFGCNQHQDN